MNVFIAPLSSEKNKKVIPEVTLLTADSLLKKICQKGLSEEMKKLSVDQIVSKLLLFQGSFLSSVDLSNSRCLLKEFAEKLVERLMNNLLMIYREPLAQHCLISDNGYFFYNLKKVQTSGKDTPIVGSLPSVEAVHVPVPTEGELDYDKAFSFFEPKLTIVPKVWSSLLEELCIEDATDLKNGALHVFLSLAGFLRDAPFKLLCSSLHFDVTSIDT
jgi:hypothetical protein